MTQDTQTHSWLGFRQGSKIASHHVFNVIVKHAVRSLSAHSLLSRESLLYPTHTRNTTTISERTSMTIVGKEAVNVTATHLGYWVVLLQEGTL